MNGDVKGYIGKEKSNAIYMTQIMNNTNKDKYKQLKELSYDRKEQGTTELNSRLLTIRERKT